MSVEGAGIYNPEEAIGEKVGKNIPNPELDNGWDDADTANPDIFCPHPELGTMEFCDPDDEVPDLDTQFPELEFIEPLNELPLIDPYSQIEPLIEDYFPETKPLIEDYFPETKPLIED